MLTRMPDLATGPDMRKLLLILVGLVFTALALLGAVLPGLPTTPFLIVALWAFARSSPRLTLWIGRVPLLQSALREALRFEQRRALRPAVKLTALACAWGSVAATAWWSGTLLRPLVGAVALAALAASVAMAWIPTDRSRG